MPSPVILPTFLLQTRAHEIGLREKAAGAREIGRLLPSGKRGNADNRGPFCAKYLKACGLGEGYAWCAAFVSWCFVEAAKELGLELPFTPSAGALHLYREVRKKGGERLDTPQPGDVYARTRGEGLGHVGFVHSIDEAKGVLWTLEGNHTPSVDLFQHPLKASRDAGRVGIAKLYDPAPRVTL